MKKICSILLALALLFSFTACSVNDAKTEGTSPSSLQSGGTSSDTVMEDGSESSSSQVSDVGSTSGDTQAKTLIVYFSCTGNTKSVAETIAQETGADLYEIVPETPYTSEDLNYGNDNCRANLEMNDPSARPAIGSDPVDLSVYGTVLIGYPIWWGTAPRIIGTFLDTYDLSGKTVMPFCTSGGSGVSQSVSDIREIAPNADVRDGLRANGESDDSIMEWLIANDLVH